METRRTLRPGMPGTKKLSTRYGERLVCVRYLYDQTRGRRLKRVELIIEEAPWHGRSRKPRRQDHDLVAVRIAWDETDLRIAVKKGQRHLAAAAKAMGDDLGGSSRPGNRSPDSRRMTARSSVADI